MFHMKTLIPFRECCVHVFKTKVSVKLTLKGELVFLMFNQHIGKTLIISC